VGPNLNIKWGHAALSKSFLVTGSPGSGKSTLIRHMLAQIQERGQRAIVLDPDAEFVQEFYSEGRGDVVLNPLDARCPFWSPWLEFRDDSFAMDNGMPKSEGVGGLAPAYKTINAGSGC
jgi:energy-coupling factor transporter ATP-binding protein EcfA2